VYKRHPEKPRFEGKASRPPTAEEIAQAARREKPNRRSKKERRGKPARRSK
jgi:hypothetical protein